MSATRVDRVKVCCAGLFCVIFLQKFGIPLGGELQGPLLIPIIGALLLYLLASGQAFIDVYDGILFGLFSCTVVLVNFVSEASFSLASVLLLLTLCSFFTFRISLTMADYRRVLGFFQFCMLIIVAIEFGQYGVQLFGRNMPILNPHVPDWLLLGFFNYTQPIYYGANMLKANGVFMLETSFMSQFVGIALAVEIAVLRRTWLIVLFLVAVMISLGGTGMILAAMAMTTIVWKQPRVLLQMSILLVVAIIVGFSYGFFDIIAARMVEFSDTQASAGVRFLLPYTRMYENMTGSLSRFLFGAGAGFLDRQHGFAWSSPSKVWVEEGFISFLFYVPFCTSIFFRKIHTPLLSAVLFAEYFFVTGGGLMQPCIVGACVFLVTGYASMQARSAAEPRLTTDAPARAVPSQRFSIQKGARA